MLGADDPKLLDAISRQWTAQSTTEDDIHYLIVSALLAGERSADVTRRTVSALLELETKLRAAGGHPSQNWPQRVAEMFEELCRRDSSLARLLVDEPAFGRPEHTLYAAHFEGDLRARATRKLLAAVRASDEPPGSELIALIAQLPAAESLPVLRRAWNEVGLRDAVLLALAREPNSDDRERFVESLASVQPKVAEQAAQALLALGPTASPVEVRIALAALGQACQVSEQSAPCAALASLLDLWTSGAVPLGEASRRDPAVLWAAWQKWFAAAYPEQAKILATSGTIDAAEWQRRLAQIDWTGGDPGAAGLFSSGRPVTAAIRRAVNWGPN